MSDDANRPGGANAAEPEVKPTAETLERRAMLRRFGTYAAFTAPALTVLMASRQSEAGGFPATAPTTPAATRSVAVAVVRWRRWRRMRFSC